MLILEIAAGVIVGLLVFNALVSWANRPTEAELLRDVTERLKRFDRGEK